MLREGIRCPACSGDARAAFTVASDVDVPARLNISACSDCGLLFARDEPPPAEIAAAYRALDTDAYYRSVGDTTSAKARRAAADLAPVLGDGASLLDVGCGYGHLLDEVRRLGATAVGQDFDARCVEKCRQRGHRAINGDLSQVTGRYRIITMLDVAEHVRDMPAFLATVHELLEPGGTLYIRTPRRSIYDACALALTRAPWLGRYAKAWFGIRLSIYHLRLWTDKSLARALGAAGFTVVSLRPEADLSWPVKRYVRTYLDRREALPRFATAAVSVAAEVAFGRLGLMRNKAVVTAIREHRTP